MHFFMLKIMLLSPSLSFERRGYSVLLPSSRTRTFGAERLFFSRRGESNPRIFHPLWLWGVWWCVVQASLEVKAQNSGVWMVILRSV